MRILIVEDDEFKAEELKKELDKYCSNAKTDIARSVRAGIAAIKSNSFNLIILDMALPSHELRKGGASPTSMPSGGLEILMELDYFGRIDDVVVFTQYPEVEIEGRLIPLKNVKNALLAEFNITVVDVVHFVSGETGWRQRIRAITEELVK